MVGMVFRMSEPRAMPSHPDELLGQLVAGRYRLLEKLGQGGMGTVYLAVHEAIEKKVAIKVLSPEYSTKPELVTRFQREAISASRIKHQHVLDVFDFGQLENGCFYLAMEFLAGHDMADELCKDFVIPVPRSIRITDQIVKALAAAHAQGVVHRDLKPENVFLQRGQDGSESVKIVDFGIAQLRTTEEAAASEGQRRRLTRTGMIFGTPEYMSPEQAAGKTADLRVDVYATGVILFEMLTGSVPFTGETFFGVLNAHLNDPLPTLRKVNADVNVSPELEAVIARALAKDPDQRFQSMAELGSALRATPEGRVLEGARTSLVPEVGPAEFDLARAESVKEFNLLQRKDSPAATAPTIAAAAVTVPNDVLAPEPALTKAEPPPAAPPPKRAYAAFIAVAVLAAGGSVVAMKLASGPKHMPSAAVSNEAPPAPSASGPIVTPVEKASMVTIKVVTEPVGAIVFKNGFQVCDKSPCEVMSVPNETLEIQAHSDQLRGSAKVLAQRDQTVTIKLETQKTTKIVSTKPPKQPGKKNLVRCMREVERPNGLKDVEYFWCEKK
jgi:serine/threonine-protein kinase